MVSRLIHKHQSNHHRKLNILLLLLPAIIYVFVIAFYLITTTGINLNNTLSDFVNAPSLEVFNTVDPDEVNIDK